MRRLPGQAARHFGRLLHRLATIALALLLLIAAGLGALAWRLSRGPLELPWLAHRIEQQAASEGGQSHLHVGSAALAWEGFSQGVDRPLDLRLADVTATASDGRRIMDVPHAQVSVSIAWLLVGKLRPRAIEVDHPRLRVLRAADGSVKLDLGALDTTPPDTAPSDSDTATPFADAFSEFGRPAETDRAGLAHSRFSQLRRLRIRDAAVTVVDRQLGLTWSAPSGNVDLSRRPRGGVDGTADITLRVGEQSAHVGLTAMQEAGGARTRLHVTLGAVSPAALARDAPGLAMLAALDAPVSGEATLDLGAGLQVLGANARAAVGAGQATFRDQTVQIVSASLDAGGTMAALALHQARLQVAPRPGGPVSTISATGSLARKESGFGANLAADLDQAAFADLPVLWPPGTGGGARPWMVQNVTAGVARAVHVEATMQAPADLSDVTLSSASGTIEGDALTVHWLRPIPPVAGVHARLRIIDPDTLEIDTQGGRQMQDTPHGQTATGIGSPGGHMRITGIMHPHQIAQIDTDLAGPFGDVVSLLKHPRLKLFEHAKLDLRDPSGAATAHLSVHLPLENDVTMDTVGIQAHGHIDNAHLTGIAAGHDLDRGAIELDVNNDGLKLRGTADLASIPAKVAAEMDFRSGPPNQVQEHVTASARATAKQLAASGLDAGTAMAGSASIEAAYTSHRDGQADVQVSADLTDAALTAGPLDWRKPVGDKTTAQVSVRLDHDHLTAIDALRVDGPGLAVHGRAAYGAGGATTLHVDRMQLGRTEAQGTIAFPGRSSSAPIAADVTGSTLDLSARLSPKKTTPAQAPAPTPKSAAELAKEDAPGPPYTVQVRFDRALMANGLTASGLFARADNDGRLFRRVVLEGRTDPRAPFRLEIAPLPGTVPARRLTATATDAGGLLRALDVIGTMRGGRLTVDARFDDTRPDHPLAGAAEIDEFRLLDAPAVGRLLQAMTLYGLVELARGPGLGFSKLVAPFRLTETEIELNDARAFSPSLGVTAKGRFDRVRDTADVQGTIVPAYFFNSLLGRMPLVGKLFSPERGGGLFAARYTVRGPLADPSVSVNPFSALTPGFLRGLFDGF